MNYIKMKKDEILKLLAHDDFGIAFSDEQNIPIWNYMLSEDKESLFVYDEDDNTINEGLIKDAPDYLFTYGNNFKKVSFKGLNLPDNIVTRNNFYLFEEQFKLI